MHLSFHLWTALILIACALGAIMGTCAYLILAERKISAWAQDRIGPNRVGPWGVLQPIADGLKFLLKEEIIPGHVDRLFYLLGPAIALSTALLAFAVVPFGSTTTPPVLTDSTVSPPRPIPWPQTKAELREALAKDPTYEQRLADYNGTLQFVIAPHVDIGILFVFAVGSLAVYAIILGGWSSNNKYSLLGSLRSSAQIISYEIPLGMSVLGIIVLSGSLNLEWIMWEQVRPSGDRAGMWNIVYQPLAFLIFMCSAFA